jgi:hypothetical protein
MAVALAELRAAVESGDWSHLTAFCREAQRIRAERCGSAD